MAKKKLFQVTWLTSMGVGTVIIKAKTKPGAVTAVKDELKKRKVDYAKDLEEMKFEVEPVLTTTDFVYFDENI